MVGADVGAIVILCLSEERDCIPILLLLFIAHEFFLYGVIQNNDKGVLVYLVLVGMVIVFYFLFGSLPIRGVQYLAPALANHFDQTHHSIPGQEKTSDETLCKVDTAFILKCLLCIFYWIGCFNSTRN